MSEVVDAQILHVDTVDEYLTLLHIIVAGNQVYECRFAAATLSYDGNGLSLRNRQVDILQNPLLTVTEAHILKLYLVLEAGQALRTCHLLDGILCHQDLVDTFHRCQTLGNVIASL